MIRCKCGNTITDRCAVDRIRELEDALAALESATRAGSTPSAPQAQRPSRAPVKDVLLSAGASLLVTGALYLLLALGSV